MTPSEVQPVRKSVVVNRGIEQAAPAVKAAAPAGPKLRWVAEGVRNVKGGKNQSGVVGDHT
jgi:hypothetical protein